MHEERTDIQVKLILQDLKYIKQRLDHITTDLESKYVRRTEFAPVRNLIYGLVGVLLLGLIGAIVQSVLR